MDDLLEPISSENTPHDEGDGSDGDVNLLLSGGIQSILDRDGDITIFDLAESVIKNNSKTTTTTVYTSKECCIIGGDEYPPDEFEDYCVEFEIVRILLNPVLASDNSEGGKKSEADGAQKVILKVAASDADAATSTIDGILRLVAQSKKGSGNDDDGGDDSSAFDVTMKCFARQPRQPLPTLTGNELRAALTSGSAAISCLRLHFCAVDGETAKVLAASAGAVELRQCTVLGLDEALLADRGPSELTISCTMPEFAGFSSGFAGNSTVGRLDLLLHFWLQGEGFANFCTSLETNKGIKKLSIKYLDINDDGWVLLMQKLQKHPTITSLKMAFTDSFVDNYRRLTPERRTARTQAVLDLVRANSNLTELAWPDFQKDEELLPQIEECIERNRSSAAA